MAPRFTITKKSFLRHHWGLSIATIICLLAAFLLLLLVGLSLTIIKSVYLASIHAVVAPGQPETSVATQLRFGVWGVCLYSVFDQHTFFTNDGDCFGPRLGYTIPPQLLELIGADVSLVNTLLKGLLILLVLHPVAAGLSLVGLMLGAFLTYHSISILALITVIISALLSSVVFAADLALVIVAKDNVKDVTVGDFTVQWGNAPWMVLAAVILTWTAVVLLSIRACYCCGIGRKYNNKARRLKEEENEEKEKKSKLWCFA